MPASRFGQKATHQLCCLWTRWLHSLHARSTFGWPHFLSGLDFSSLLGRNLLQLQVQSVGDSQHQHSDANLAHWYGSHACDATLCAHLRAASLGVSELCCARASSAQPRLTGDLSRRAPFDRPQVRPAANSSRTIDLTRQTSYEEQERISPCLGQPERARDPIKFEPAGASQRPQP